MALTIDVRKIGIAVTPRPKFLLTLREQRLAVSPVDNYSRFSQNRGSFAGQLYLGIRLVQRYTSLRI